MRPVRPGGAEGERACAGWAVRSWAKPEVVGRLRLVGEEGEAGTRGGRGRSKPAETDWAGAGFAWAERGREGAGWAA